MGNRVVIQFVGADNEVSPAIYGHWYGSQAAEMLVALRDQMADRPSDVAYVAARCLGRMIDGHTGSTGFGTWNAPAKLTAEDSPVDAGVFVVTLGERWQVNVLGGRLSERGTLPKASPKIKFTVQS